MTGLAAAAFISFGFLGFGSVTVNFDNLKPGSLPPYWTATATRDITAPRWAVMRDATAPSRPNVFSQVASVTNNAEFPLAVFDKVICKDGDLSVKFEIAASTRRIKTAGIVWRYQDPQNYYLLHFSVDERNIALFHVENGQARPLPVIGGRPGDIGVSHDLKTGEWYVAKVVFRGNAIKVLFGNRELFNAVDGSIAVPGKTGLWTRGGTVAAFDDFRIDRKG